MTKRFAQKGFAPILIVVILGLIAVVGVSLFKGGSVGKKSDEKQVDTSIYSNYDDKISINTPAKWQIKENPTQGTQVSFFSPKENEEDRFIENVNLQISDLSANPEIVLDDIVKAWNNQSLVDYPDSFKIVTQDKITLSGVDAVKIVYLASDNISALKGMTIIFFKDGKAYSINYASEEKSYEKFLPAVEKLVKSIKLEAQEIKWEDYKSEEYGYSLKLPVGWLVKDNPKENGREITVTHPQGKVIVIITALKDENLKDLDYMKESIKAFKDKLENDPTILQIANFADQVEEDTGGFIAIGEEKRLDKNWYFEQRGLLGTSGKVLLFHGATLSPLYNDYKDVITKIIVGFKLE